MLPNLHGVTFGIDELDAARVHAHRVHSLLRGWREDLGLQGRRATPCTKTRQGSTLTQSFSASKRLATATTTKKKSGPRGSNRPRLSGPSAGFRAVSAGSKSRGRGKPRGLPSARKKPKRGASQPTKEAPLRHLEARCAGWESRFQLVVRTRASRMRAGWVLMAPSLAWSCSCQVFERL